jgi:hypothetical protein
LTITLWRDRRGVWSGGLKKRVSGMTRKKAEREKEKRKNMRCAACD